MGERNIKMQKEFPWKLISKKSYEQKCSIKSGQDESQATLRILAKIRRWFQRPQDRSKLVTIATISAQFSVNTRLLKRPGISCCGNRNYGQKGVVIYTIQFEMVHRFQIYEIYRRRCSNSGVIVLNVQPIPWSVRFRSALRRMRRSNTLKPAWRGR